MFEKKHTIKTIITIFPLFLLTSNSTGQTRTSPILPKTVADDVFDKFTSVGQLGATITNFGVLGNGWNKINGKILPSCQYRQQTEILRKKVEHFSFSGL
ncbi:MAG: hypothetical protein IIB44_00855 [Candidatus Marinimicrobia bacterium]|nr:hypothetical protein [Candidatus Neomarinimicrobiota bacterium]